MNMTENCLSVDLEEWFQANSYRKIIPAADWNKLGGNLAGTIHEILEILGGFKTKATFFVVGYNAKRYPELIRLIGKEGHELGVHGYYHKPVFRQTPAEFRNEIDYSKKLIEDLVMRL